MPITLLPLGSYVWPSTESSAGSFLPCCRFSKCPEEDSVPSLLGYSRETFPNVCFYLENAELSGKFDQEGCSCIHVLLPGDLNAFFLAV